MAKLKKHKMSCPRCGIEFMTEEELFGIRCSDGSWKETKGYQAVCPKCGILVKEWYLEEANNESGKT